MPWISNHKHAIEEKSTKSSRSSSKIASLGSADLWKFPTLLTSFSDQLSFNQWFLFLRDEVPELESSGPDAAPVLKPLIKVF